MAALRVLLAFAALCLLPISALADQERILSFDSVVTVNADGSADVTETITVVARGNAIRRGIYRDLIPPAQGWLGSMAGQPYRVLSARRDGSPESWHTAGEDGMFRIYLGKKDVLLRPGTYTYALSYRALSQVRFFNDYDEIYWNVTGNRWAFPIERARALIVLPPGADVKQFAAYTGPAGAKGVDFTARKDGPGRVYVEATRPLAPGEGLTAAVAWPKGLVPEPTWQNRVLAALAGNPFMAASAASFLAMMAYFIAAWFKVGRDPAPGTVIPLYAPPRDMSPAAVQYVSGMGHDSKDLACTVVNLAVNGVLSIDETSKGEFSLTARDPLPSIRTMEEDAAAKALFKSTSTVAMDRSNRQRLLAAKSALRKSLSGSYSGYLFNLNAGWFVPGALLAAVVALTAAFSGREREFGLFMSVWLSVWTLGTVFLLSRVGAAWREAVSGRMKFLKLAGALFITAFSLPFLAGEIAGLYLFGENTSPLALALLMASVTVCASFYHLLKAPTREGREVMDQIEGFKLYLAVAEEDRLNLLNPPEETPELFEKFLPYAMALGVEQQWGERFADVLARAAQAPDGYTPGWYHGAGWDPSSPMDFTDSLASGFASAVAASSSSSSGSGGGGSSGGGGGGGGGGGW
ncbi:MAG: DUF2207 domain-containing protein [Thermodesulfobacteriota bacterium]